MKKKMKKKIHVRTKKNIGRTADQNLLTHKKHLL